MLRGRERIVRGNPEMHSGSVTGAARPLRADLARSRRQARRAVRRTLQNDHKRGAHYVRDFTAINTDPAALTCTDHR